MPQILSVSQYWITANDKLNTHVIKIFANGQATIKIETLKLKLTQSHEKMILIAVKPV